jgi:hypothetical protein
LKGKSGPPGNMNALEFPIQIHDTVMRTYRSTSVAYLN